MSSKGPNVSRVERKGSKFRGSKFNGPKAQKPNDNGLFHASENIVEEIQDSSRQRKNLLRSMLQLDYSLDVDKNAPLFSQPSSSSRQKSAAASSSSSSIFSLTPSSIPASSAPSLSLLPQSKQPSVASSSKSQEEKTSRKRKQMSSAIPAMEELLPATIKALDSASVENAKNLDTKVILSKDAIVVGGTAPAQNPSLERKQLIKKGVIKVDENAGSKWFGLPATPLTPEIHADLTVLKMRDVIDSFSRVSASRELPKYFQMGTVVEGPSEGSNQRLTKKERKARIVDTLLADKKFMDKTKLKYNEIATEQRRLERTKRSFKKKKRDD